MNRTIRDIRKRAYESLKEVSSDSSNEINLLEVDVLLADVLACSRESLIAYQERLVSESDIERFEANILQRQSGTPIAYIVGKREFYGLSFAVTPDVLIPRPETEHLVTRVLELSIGKDRCPTSNLGALIDVGTGSGAIVLSVADSLKKHLGADEFRRCLFVGSDLSQQAIRVAQNNSQSLGLEESVSFVVADLLQSFARISAVEGLKIITANLPYVPEDELLPVHIAEHEPSIALRSGWRGLDAINEFIGQCGHIGKEENIVILLEIGQGQCSEVECELRRNGFCNIKFHQDYQGIIRVVEAGVTSE